MIVCNLKDLVVVLIVMVSVGFDFNDNVMVLVLLEVWGRDYLVLLYGGSLMGWWFGFLDGFLNYIVFVEMILVNDVMVDMVEKLKGVGVIVVNIIEFIYNIVIFVVFDV